MALALRETATEQRPVRVESANGNELMCMLHSLVNERIHALKILPARTQQ